MKKLLFILPAVFFILAVNAQQTEDEVHVGSYPKGKTFGNYKNAGIIIPDVDRGAKPVDGIKTLSGTVTGICTRDCCNKKASSCTITLKNTDGVLTTIGTRDYGFTVPNEIIGHTINVEGITPASLISDRRRREVKKDYQKDIQFAATGIMVID